jgi:hypothetical protein
LAMQPHGGKSCPCGCIARFSHLPFLPLKLVHQHKHDAGDFFTTALDHSSPSLSENHITPTPAPPPSHRLHCRGSGRFGDLRLGISKQRRQT